MEEISVLHELPPYLHKGVKVAIDIEMYGLERPHRPTSGEFACITACVDGKTVYMVDDVNLLPEFFDRIEYAYWILQNAKFDITHLRRWVDIQPRQRLHDTMLAEQVMYSGLYETFGLKALARRYLHRVIDKETRELFKEATEMDDEMRLYAAYDPVYTWQIAHAQRLKMDDNDKFIYKNVDLPAMWAIMDFKGFRMDVDLWTGMAKAREAEANALNDKYEEINLGSWQQVKAEMHTRGHKIRSTSAAVLEKYPDEEFAVDTIQYRKIKKLASTYGLSWIPLLEDNKMYCDYKTIGAKHGRMASANPNMQNIPTRDNPEYREAWIASKKHTLAVADFSSQEVRTLAEICQDENLIAALHRGGNIYIQIGRDTFNRNIEKGTKEYDDIKALVLGTNYGMSVWGLAERTGDSEQEAKAKQSLFFRAYPGIKEYMWQQGKQTKFVTTILGRKSWLNPHNQGLCFRNALNSPVSGSAADQMKLAMGIFHRSWRKEFPDYPYPVVGVVHDELVTDIPNKILDEGKQLLEESMIRSGRLVHPSVPAVAEVHTGKNWRAKK